MVRGFPVRNVAAQDLGGSFGLTLGKLFALFGTRRAGEVFFPVLAANEGELGVSFVIPSLASTAVVQPFAAFPSFPAGWVGAG
jgi:hypothetical protein